MAIEGLRLVEPRGLTAGAGVDWIGEGWRLFAKSPLMWVISILVLFVLAIVVNIVPFIGGLAFQLLQPVFGAGFIVACRSLETGGEFELEHVFAGFKKNFANLLVVGLILVAGGIALLLVFAVFAGFGLVTAFMTGDANNMLPALMASGMSIALGTLVMLFLMIPLLMAYWFAPALVVFRNEDPMAAMKTSFHASVVNMMPMLVYSLLGLVFAIVATIPLFLGWLVLAPVFAASVYASYKDIFPEP